MITMANALRLSFPVFLLLISPAFSAEPRLNRYSFTELHMGSQFQIIVYAVDEPDAKELAHALELVGYDKVKLDAKAHTIQLMKAGMLLDLGGIAKGYAADAALAVLKKHGITRALVAAGGDIAVSGPPPDTNGWT